MDYIPFDSRNELFKSPFSALRAGEQLHLRVVLPRSLVCSALTLVLDNDTGATTRFAFTWDRMQGSEEEWWALDAVIRQSGLYYYHFEYETPFGVTALMCGEGSCGLLLGGHRRWQLTVYDRDFCVPDWLRGGLIYQIFPDRFFASGSEKENVPSDRELRDDWGGEPKWRPTKTGRVLNNDYFGGDLKGIMQKLPYLKSLGVTCIYLNPIFEAQSNHRYDTADYHQIDPLLGTKDDFAALCKTAKLFGVRILLDGVFSHTGDDSRYFNKYGRYPDTGAYQSKDSPFYEWYKFRQWPKRYASWWGIDILPEVREETPSYIDFIAGPQGVAQEWLRLGASGWRLDVADELPDEFLDAFRARVKATDPEALILGEVWEDASNKCSYGERRRYLQGEQLDSVMNYPFARAILDFIRTGIVEGFSEKIYTILEHYPKDVVDVLMNHIGTHDTMRAITALAGADCADHDRDWQSATVLSDEDYSRGVRLLKLAAMIQYTLPGVPSLYYGDEAGMQGYKDPFNRVCYPWGHEDAELLAFYRELGHVRQRCACLKDGRYHTVSEMLGCLCFARVGASDEILTIINRNDHPIVYHLPAPWHGAACLLGGKQISNSVTLDALDGVILRIQNE